MRCARPRAGRQRRGPARGGRRAGSQRAARALPRTRSRPGRTFRSSFLPDKGRCPSRWREAMELLGNVTVLERPMRVAALVSAIRTAVRARQRQYQIRDQLLQREAVRAPVAAEHRGNADAARDAADRRVHRPRSRVQAHHRQPQRERAPSHVPGREPVEVRPCAERARALPRVQGWRRGRDRADLPMQRAARGERVRSEALDHVFDDGTTVNTIVSAMPLFDRMGRPRGAVGAIMDVTEHRRHEAALREADRRKDEYLAMLAHELRNPLAPIRNSLHLVRLATEHDPQAAPRHRGDGAPGGRDGAAGRRSPRRLAHHARRDLAAQGAAAASPSSSAARWRRTGR